MSDMFAEARAAHRYTHKSAVYIICQRSLERYGAFYDINVCLVYIYICKLWPSNKMAAVYNGRSRAYRDQRADRCF